MPGTNVAVGAVGAVAAAEAAAALASLIHPACIVSPTGAV